MSTTAVPDFGALIDQALQTPPAQPPTPAQIQPVAYNIGGQSFQFNDPTQAAQMLSQSLDKVLQNQRAMEEELGRLRSAPPTQVPATPLPEVGNGKDKFFEEFLADPDKALSKSKAYTQMQEQMQQVQAQNTVMSFVFKHPEYNDPGMLTRIGQVQANMGLPFNLNGLDAALNTAIQHNVVPHPMQIRAQQYQQPPAQGQGGWQSQNGQVQKPPQFQQPVQRQWQSPAPPPQMGGSTNQPGSGSADPMQLERFAKLNTSEMEKALIMASQMGYKAE